MFDKYFVKIPVAIALKKAGFDEPCIGVHEYYTHQDITTSILRISYNNHALDKYDRDDEVIRQMVLRRGLIEERRCNSELPQWLFAAPFYDQVLDWLESKGVYIHPYRIPEFQESSAKWGVNVYDLSGNLLWPKWNLDSEIKYFQDKYEARCQALLPAIDLIYKL